MALQPNAFFHGIGFQPTKTRNFRCGVPRPHKHSSTPDRSGPERTPNAGPQPRPDGRSHWIDLVPAWLFVTAARVSVRRVSVASPRRGRVRPGASYARRSKPWRHRSLWTNLDSNLDWYLDWYLRVPFRESKVSSGTNLDNTPISTASDNTPSMRISSRRGVQRSPVTVPVISPRCRNSDVD